MLIVSEEELVFLANSLFHGVDMSSIIRMDIPVWENGLGILETFVLLWFFGFITAVLYYKITKTKNETS